MTALEILSLVAVLFAIGSGGMLAFVKSASARADENKKQVDQRIDDNKKLIDQRIDDNKKSTDQRIDKQCDALHLRVNKSDETIQSLHLHIAENYVRSDHLEKALTNMENSVLKEVKALGDKMEMTNRHVSQLVTALQKSPQQ